MQFILSVFVFVFLGCASLLFWQVEFFPDEPGGAGGDSTRAIFGDHTSANGTRDVYEHRNSPSDAGSMFFRHPYLSLGLGMNTEICLSMTLTNIST
jgi:hypothetical protein